jgi:hypothetical protein
MGKKPFSKKPSGLERSRIKSFENKAGIELDRIGGKKVRNSEREIAEDIPIEETPFEETILYAAPISELVVNMPVTTEKREIKRSFGENFMRGLRNFIRGERY